MDVPGPFSWAKFANQISTSPGYTPLTFGRMGLDELGGLLFLIWVAFWIWALKAAYGKIASTFGNALSGDWSAAFRGSAGREWDRDAYARLSQVDQRRQNAAPPSLDEMTDDLEATLREEEASAAELTDAIRQREENIRGLHRHAADWRERAGVAVAKGRDDLARQALAEAQDCDTKAAASERAVAELRTILDSYTDEIATLRQRLNEGLSRKLVAEARLERARIGQRASRLLQDDGTDKLDQAIDRFERQADTAEGQWQAQALGGFGRKKVSAAPSLPAPETIPPDVTKRWDAAIERQLQELKRRSDPPSDASAA